MSLTTFSGPVRSLNGFITGSIADPVVVTEAGNISSSYGTASNTTGDVRLSYNRLAFTSTGSGETIRALTQVTGANAATGGTVNGAHLSLSVNGSGTISGAGNALRVTLGGTSTNPGGTISALQLDSDFATGGTWSNASYLRLTNSGTGEVGNFAQMPAVSATGVFRVKVGSPVVSHTIPVTSGGVTYYIMVSTIA